MQYLNGNLMQIYQKILYLINNNNYRDMKFISKPAFLLNSAPDFK